MWQRIQKQVKCNTNVAEMYPTTLTETRFAPPLHPPSRRSNPNGGYNFVDGGAYTDGTTTTAR